METSKHDTSEAPQTDADSATLSEPQAASTSPTTQQNKKQRKFRDKVEGPEAPLRKKKPVAPAPRDIVLQSLTTERGWTQELFEQTGISQWRWRILGNILLLPPLPPAPLSPLHIQDVVHAFRKALPNVDGIVALEGKIQGELRTPRVVVLTPDRPTETIHIENGIKFCLDVTKVMFAAGNGTERMRFATFPVKGQVVADMFAGIGYFTLPVAKYGQPATLIALEKNPDSAHFLRRNAVLNKVQDIVRVYEGDNRETASEWLGLCDRVFMGYLPSAEPFFPRALQLAKPDRCIIHYHYFASKEDSAAVPLAHLMPHLEALGRAKTTRVTVLHIENVKNYAPHLWHYVADLLLEATD